MADRKFKSQNTADAARDRVTVIGNHISDVKTGNLGLYQIYLSQIWLEPQLAGSVLANLTAAEVEARFVQCQKALQSVLRHHVTGANVFFYVKCIYCFSVLIMEPSARGLHDLSV